MNWLQRHAKTLVILTLLIGSSIAMMQLKPAYELNRDSYAEEKFKIAQLILILTIGYVVFSFLFDKWKEYRNLKNSHAQAQLELLKSKMDPHFFFNTLNNLYGLAVEKSDETGPIILKLSEVMRYTIYNGAKELVPLSEELDYLKQYIEIHRIRYKKQVEINLEEEFSDEDCLVAPLLFINLVENAFKHGVETLTDNAYINLLVRADSNTVYFEVENNHATQSKRSDGLGLKNLQDRLALIYPKRHQLTIESSDTIYKATLQLHLK